MYEPKRRTYIPQPALQVIKRQGRMVKWCADELGVERYTLSNVLHGQSRPTSHILHGLPALLGVDIRECWTTPVLPASAPPPEQEPVAS
jgi:lambda repressor-like predicted transcriptional regulator